MNAPRTLQVAPRGEREIVVTRVLEALGAWTGFGRNSCSGPGRTAAGAFKNLRSRVGLG
jgi:hypothetical protein